MSFVSITIAPRDTDFVVKLTEDGGAETSADLPRAALTSGDWKANLDGVLPPPAGDIVTRVSSAGRAERQHKDFGEIAQTLYDWMFPPGPVRTRWDALRGATPHVYFWTPDDALARLPWELASRAGAPDKPAYVNGFSRLVTRGVDPAPSSPWPFRILVVVGCRAAEEEALGIADEVRAIERCFLKLGRSVDVETVYRPDKAMLLERIGKFRPHVFHFAGHGEMYGGAASLRFDLGEAGAWLWDSQSIPYDLLAERWTPRFVFLNACRSASEQSGSWGVQQSFLAAGAEAVLGMQADVSGERAGAFAAELYRSCATGATLETAVREGRKKIREIIPNLAYIDWALPTLATTERELKLFKLKEPPDDEAFERCKEFDDARFFADCRELRRDFTHWIFPTFTASSQYNALVLTGEPKSGKSHLLKWCMETWALGDHNRRVRYIEIRAKNSKTFLSVLRQIRDGECTGDVATRYLHSGLPQTAFNRFNWELNNLLRAGQAGEWDEARTPLVIADEMAQMTAKGEERLEPAIGASFVAALRVAAAERPLILVFDHFSGTAGERFLPVDDFEQLVAHVFRPILADEASSIKLVFSANATEFAGYGLRSLPPEHTLVHEVPVDFEPDRLATLAAEMVWFEDEDYIKNTALMLFGHGKRRAGAGPNGLARLRSLLGALQDERGEAWPTHVVRMR